MSGSPEFRIDVYQNEYLPEGASLVNAIVTVTSQAGAAPATAGTVDRRLAEAIIVDCSGSMDYPRSKIQAAKRATSTAIDTLPDGVSFAVIVGNDQAYHLYPADGSLAVAGPATRAEAKQALGRLGASGGTAIGRWLTMANQTLSTAPSGAIRHAILLTDGRNQHEGPAELDAAIAACQGRFVCDCRGVGTDWEVSELRKIASGLLGTVDIVANPADLEADFRAMTSAAMGKAVADVVLRLWTPKDAAIQFVKQVAPTIEDLTGRRTSSGPQRGDYPLGSWGTELRDYHVCVQVPVGKVGDVMLAGRVSVVGEGSEPLAQGMIKAVWTDDEALSTRISVEVAHYTGQAELAEAIQDGMAARRAGDVERATSKLGRAVKLALDSGNAESARLLANVVDVVDPVTGTVRLKSKVSEEDAMTLDTRSTKTSRVRGNKD
ncbi:MAG TPA: VWA domain-containing protein [Pseudonocardiaceae bacterium]